MNSSSIVAELKAILYKFLEEDFRGQTWPPGAEWGQTLMGNAFIGAIQRYEPEYDMATDPVARAIMVRKRLIKETT